MNAVYIARGDEVVVEPFARQQAEAYAIKVCTWFLT